MNLAALIQPATAHVLVVDDDPDLLRLLSLRLRSNGYRVTAVDSAESALARVAVERPDLVLSDVKLPGRDGLALFDELRAQYPALPVILLTAHGTIPDAVAATARGVFGYLTKPFDSQELLEKIRLALTVAPASPANDANGEAWWREEIVCRSRCMVELLEEARLVGATDASVLIQGESGSGKELLARAIHRASARAAKPFIAVNCGAIPEALLESELFGHEKGAFTGAHVSKPGLFEVAAGGTVFLDEVSGMSQTLQSRLLRVLQERQMRRVGGIRFLDVDVRVIAASNQDLEAACRRGEFREDLYYRLNVIPIVLPPLRRREGDIPMLAREFLRRFMKQQGSAPGVAPDLDPTATELLCGYAWPGNVRELQNVIERAAVLADGPLITAAHLPERLRQVVADEAVLGEAGSFKHAKQAAVTTFERSFLIDLLKRHDGHMGRAAREAGVDRKTIERMVKKHGLRERS